MKTINIFFVTTFCLCMVAFSGKTNAQTYDTVAVRIINSLIDNNGLTGYAKDDPDNWDFADWDNSNPKQLIELDFYSADIFDLTGEISFVGLTNLEYLDCDENNITALELTGCTKLETLYCGDNLLTELDLSGLTNLTGLGCYKNILDKLNVSSCTSLEWLDCTENVITELDVSGLANLEDLDCPLNYLTKLNVNGCTNLNWLFCGGNYLTELNLSGLANLEYLLCLENNLTELNVSGCANLLSLNCNDNSLTTLDLTGVNKLDDFWGNYQVVSLTLQASTSENYTYNISLNNPTFDQNAISYSNGVLTSSNRATTSTNFTVETGISGYELSGIMNFNYGAVGISEISQDKKLQIYPNPTTDKLKITNYENGSIEIFDVSGRNVVTYYENTGNEIIIDVSFLSSGVYFLRIGSKMMRFVKD